MRYRFPPGILSASLFLGGLYWAISAWAEAILFHRGPLLQQLMPDLDAPATFPRLLALGLFLIMGVVVSLVAARGRKGEESPTPPGQPPESRRRGPEWSRDPGAQDRDMATILANISDAVISTDEEGRINFANPAMQRLLGYAQEELQGKHLLNLFPQEVVEEQSALVHELREAGTLLGVELECLHKDGTLVPVEAHGNAHPLESDGGSGFTFVLRDVRGRRKAQQALREGENRFREFIELLPEAVFEANDKLILTYANRRAFDLFGYTQADLRDGIHALSVLVPEDREPAADRFRMRSTGETLGPARYTGLRKDGSTFPILFHASSQMHEGQVRGLRGVIVDITERKLAESEAANRDQALLRAEALAHLGRWTFDLNKGTVTGSEEARRIYGLEGSHWTIPAVQAIPLPEYRSRMDRAFTEMVEDGKPYDLVFEIRQVDTGEVRVVHSVAQYDRRSNQVTGMIQDVTEQKRAEASYRESEERFRSVIEQSNDAIYILFQDRFDLVNRKFCQMVGVTPEEVRAPSFSFWDLVAEESRPLILERQEKRNRGVAIPDLYEFQIRRTDGLAVHVEASVTVIDYMGGSAILGVLRDITDQKSLQSQLNQAQKMESIGRLSGGVAHDLNNLLTPIIGYSELLRDDLDPGDGARESAEEIVRAGFRAKDLVRQLLAFSRQQTLEFKPLDLNGLVAGFEKLLRRTIREDIEVRVNLMTSTPMIQGDRGQLEQVIMNLAINAQDAMISGGTLHIETGETVFDEAFATTRPGVTPGPYALLSITDTGLGMEAEVRERIFEPFFTTKEKGHGTGLGLATVYGIVKQHGGNIWVYSEPGEGTTFKCYFPLTESVDEQKQPVGNAEVRLGGSETIMVVEDEAMVRKLAVSILERQGYQVLSAEDGPECLRLLENRSEPIDLLLTDVVLPGMNGREIKEEVSLRFPGSKVLFMSGYSDEVVTHRGVLDQGISFLQKPFSVQALSQKVREVLDRA